MTMRREDKSIFAGWAGLLIIFLFAVYVARDVIDAMGDVLAAAVAGIFVLIGGIWTHALTRIREQSLMQERDMRVNYSALLERIGDAIRRGDSDAFSAAHLQSWVVGSMDAVRITQEFLEASDNKARKHKLEKMVRVMRRDVGLSSIGQDLTLDSVFPQQGGF